MAPSHSQGSSGRPGSVCGPGAVPGWGHTSWPRRDPGFLGCHQGRAFACTSSNGDRKAYLRPSVLSVSCWKHKISFLICSLVILSSCVCFQIFEQFVKTRVKEEYKEKRSKLLLAKEEFRKLLEESKVSPRYRERGSRQFLGLEYSPTVERGLLKMGLVKPRNLAFQTSRV